MLKNCIKRIFTLTIISTTLFAIVPMSAHAEWRSVANKWYWREGDSYAEGWKEINNKKYYFDSNGAMARNTMMDGYYINGSGVAVSIAASELPIKIPSTWKKIDKQKAASYYIDDKAVLVYDTSSTFGYSESSFIDEMKQAINYSTSGIQVSNKTYNGLKATCMEYEFTSDSEALKADIVIFFKNNKAYAFFVVSNLENYNYGKQEFEDMLNSTLVL